MEEFKVIVTQMFLNDHLYWLGRPHLRISQSDITYWRVRLVVYKMEVTNEQIRRRAGKKFADELYKNFFPSMIVFLHKVVCGDSQNIFTDRKIILLRHVSFI